MNKGLIAELPEKMTKKAETASIPELLEFTSSHARECGFQGEIAEGIKLAVEEVLQNILRFSCKDGQGEISVSCSVYDSDSFIITVTDTGPSFNMLLASTFPEARDFSESGEIPSTKMMKRYIRNIEYKRGTNENMLIFIVSRGTLGSR